MEARPGQGEFALVGQAQNSLDRSLAERAAAYDQGAIGILQGRGDDFRGRGRVSIDEHDHWTMGDPGVAPGLEVLMAVWVASVGGDDPAILQKEVGHADRLIQQSSGVGA